MYLINQDNQIVWKTFIYNISISYLRLNDELSQVFDGGMALKTVYVLVAGFEVDEF